MFNINSTTEILDLSKHIHINKFGIDIYFKLEDDFHTEEFLFELVKGLANFRSLINYKNNNPKQFYICC